MNDLSIGELCILIHNHSLMLAPDKAERIKELVGILVEKYRAEAAKPPTSD